MSGTADGMAPGHEGSYRALEAAYAALEQARDGLEREVAERTREVATIRRLFEAATRGAQITVASQDRDLRYTWIHNPWPGMSEAEIIGRTDDEIFPEPGRSTVVAGKRRAIMSGQPESFEVELPADEGTAWLRIDVTPILDSAGAVEGIVCTAIDATRDKRLEAMRSDLSRRLSETVQRFNLALNSSDIVVFSQDADLRYTWANTTATPLGIAVGRTDNELYAEPVLSRIVALKREAMADRAPRTGEIRVELDGDTRWYEIFVEPNVSLEGEVTGVTCAAVDISRVKRDEAQMRLVMRELTHRSKNLLAVVQAIARQTAHNAGTVPDFVESFGERLRALAGAQDLLVAENWAGARLDHLVAGQVGHYVAGNEQRFSVSGPQITMTPEATQVLGLALHELATNAAKYGALSNDTGSVAIDWSFERADGRQVVRLSWFERGGPPVQPPRRRGFGRIVVERNVSRSLDADVALEFHPDGVRATFVVPIEQLVRSGPA